MVKTLSNFFFVLLIFICTTGFMLSLTHVPYAEAGDDKFCEVDDSLYCWYSGPLWRCLTNKGDEMCEDKVVFQ